MFKTILLKEVKDMLRDKRSITLLILMPLLLMTGLTFFYDKMLEEDDEEVYTLVVHERIDKEFITAIQEMTPEMEIIKANDVNNQIEEKEAHIGLVVDEEWKSALENRTPLPIEVLYDSSSQKSNQARNMMMSILSAWESNLLQQRLEEEKIESDVINVFDIKEVSIKEEGGAIASFMLTILLPLIIPVAVANGSYPAATELFAGEKEKKTMEALLITPVKRIQILLAKWMAISLLGVFTGLFSIIVFLIEIQFAANLKAGFSMIQHPIQFISSSMILIILFALFISAAEMILSMLANTVKEAGYYMGPLIGIITIPMIFMFFMEESLNTILYAVPVLNLFLFVRDTFSEQFTLNALIVACVSYILIIIILFFIANKMFRNHRLMLGK